MCSDPSRLSVGAVSGTFAWRPRLRFGFLVEHCRPRDSQFAHAGCLASHLLQIRFFLLWQFSQLNVMRFAPGRAERERTGADRICVA
ncbi:hypothetical protein KCU67_g44, partial [Aureobasidium melanogenum]